MPSASASSISVVVVVKMLDVVVVIDVVEVDVVVDEGVSTPPVVGPPSAKAAMRMINITKLRIASPMAAHFHTVLLIKHITEFVFSTEVSMISCTVF